MRAITAALNAAARLVRAPACALIAVRETPGCRVGLEYCPHNIRETKHPHGRSCQNDGSQGARKGFFQRFKTISNTILKKPRARVDPCTCPIFASASHKISWI